MYSTPKLTILLMKTNVFSQDIYQIMLIIIIFIRTKQDNPIVHMIIGLITCNILENSFNNNKITIVIKCANFNNSKIKTQHDQLWSYVSTSTGYCY